MGLRMDMSGVAEAYLCPALVLCAPPEAGQGPQTFFYLYFEHFSYLSKHLIYHKSDTVWLFGPIHGWPHGFL